MFKKTSILAYLFVFFCILTKVSVAGDRQQHEYNGVEADSQLLIVKLIGDSVAFTPDWEISGVDGEVVCHDMDLLDLKINKIIGRATDCFSDVEMDVMGGASFTGTSFLHFPDGVIITQGKFTARPVLQETTVRSGKVIDTITGAASTGNSFIGGTGIYENSTGNVRISGMVGGPGYSFSPGDELYFDCIFEIQLNEPVY